MVFLRAHPALDADELTIVGGNEGVPTGMRESRLISDSVVAPMSATQDLGQLRIGLRHIRYVVVASECGSFRRAAQILGVEQSAISRRIREVEIEVGARIFRRHTGGVELTSFGRTFVHEVSAGARQIRSAIEQARAEADRRRELRIGVFGPITIGELPKIIGAFRRERPDVRLLFREAGMRELIQAVRRGQLDVSIVPDREPKGDCGLTPLWEEPVFLAMSEDDPLSETSMVEWADLHDRHFVVTNLPTGDFARDYLKRQIAALGRDLRVEQLPVTRESLMPIIAQGGVLTIAGSAHARSKLDGVTFRPIKDAILRYVAVHNKQPSKADIRRLLTLARSLSSADTG